ncbi:D-3-phosphoglycerate dehydrogenase [Caballeronia glathei]|jgi:D-3-phosphoglycerate dehydrogenase|uniref:3-phosphoglycerate dehydrogenase n=1 Tax=Caballeronia glathei TaxID=60547 RepID=A0A069PMH1_9BURK|nr:MULTISPECIES: D-2-hydroxyacid dehydrogenase family protein [Burkholderiaceae]KDR38496.1 3-phosphoglycerate dehydrogenase [Caballeronia glathei]TCK35060.1 D-3-phosphoglycerate dehydrogenase [Paraburkholderia sp. BL8N3]CDY75007.1 D-3-phosphoglycerate dehydrogenase [Caballeronia glathei]
MKVVISDDYQNCIRTLDCYPALAAHFDVEIHNDTVTTLDAIAERFADADAMLLVRERTPVSAALLARLPRLKFISQTGRAANHVDLAACTARGIPVSAEGSATTAAAELTWALVMASMRKVHLEAARLAAGLWQGHLGVGLKGRTLGIAGYGKIGSVVAGYGRAFGMRVVALGDHETSLAAAAADGIETQTDRRAFFSEADVVCCHLRLLPATRGSITIDDLSAMKPTALFVNTSRSEVIEPGALESALKAGRPGFAAVDVYEREPIYGADHPLLGLDNVLATPHIGYVEKDTYEHYFGIAIEQLLAWRAGSPVNVLNPQALVTPGAAG